ncbi:DUF4231 domain-containing protein [Actinacidiphila bryophytorum]|uniref:SMODS and SLOG-associating 2TM effector domain-containing protein n=3 Tax=Actinacidiphila bryophytorum TaxID=1436133 RepID=A0A9W4H1V1_9ACTN|nr:DUF4231 domain-containing protein [Actinacidiphila bryophytorum]MBM9435230.1 DUF4231 domain-containing protein [Actinacidiphila bryophytorum]CAG7643843.1 conserved membrane hypothetical protein [Actinacidiphila bryophytorum]
MAVVGSAGVVGGIWGEQGGWSKAAGRQKKVIGRVRAGALLCGVLAAVLGAGAAQIGGGHPGPARWTAFAAAAAAGAVPLLTGQVGRREVQDWTRLRSTSEAYKTEVYSFLAGVGPYRSTADPAALLRSTVNGIRTEASDLLPHLSGIDLDGSRPLPAVSDVDSYVEVRLRGQISGYYRPRAAWMHGRLVVVRRTELALGLLGVLLAAGSGAFYVEQLAAWVAVVSTVAATLVAYATAAKYEYQELEFLRTAAELERLLAEWEASSDHGPAAADTLVSRCEHVISVLNDTWMVKWTSEA